MIGEMSKAKIVCNVIGALATVAVAAIAAVVLVQAHRDDAKPALLTHAAVRADATSKRP